ncbi:hypothetical protein ACQKGI_06695 [Peribacillus muralis]|uniref:hypothetical protein n=1 Tax=Peribacillus muralis TaxID=264697 RepID=UPI00380CD323
MNSFKGLVQKEWLVGKTTLLWLLALQAGFVCLAFFAASYWEVAGLFYLCTWLNMLVQPLFIFSVILSCLHSEGKTMLWIHNPQSAAMLLGSKLSISMFFQVASIFFSACIVFGGMMIPESLFKKGFHNETMLDGGSLLMTAGVLVMVSLALAVFTLFLWIVYHALAGNDVMKPLRVLLISAFCLGMLFFRNWLVSTGLYMKLDELWTVPIISDSSFSMSLDHFEFSFQTGGSLSLLTSGFELIGLVILFLISCWLLDRKIEV